MSPNPLHQICLSFLKAFSSLLVKLFAFHSLPNHNGLCCTFPCLDWSGKNFNCTLSNSCLNISHFSPSSFPTVSRNPIKSTFHLFKVSYFISLMLSGNILYSPLKFLIHLLYFEANIYMSVCKHTCARTHRTVFFFLLTSYSFLQPLHWDFPCVAKLVVG